MLFGFTWKEYLGGMAMALVFYVFLWFGMAIG